MKRLLIGGLLACSGAICVAGPAADVEVLADGLIVNSFASGDHAVVKVFHGDELVSQSSFDASEGLLLPFTNQAGTALTDGSYTYRIEVAPKVLGMTAASGADLANGRTEVPVLADSGRVMQGNFRILDGMVPMAIDEPEFVAGEMEK